MTEDLYPYGDGDRLNDRNTYFYTPSVGVEMLQAWIDRRASLLERLPSPVAEAPPASDSASGPLSIELQVDTRWLLERLWLALAEGAIDPSTEEWLKKLVRKFETVKRFHRTYDSKLMAVDKSLYEDLGLYVRAAEIMLRAFQLTNRLPYLNAVLKISDTLSSAATKLNSDEGSRFARVVRAEHVELMKLADAR